MAIASVLERFGDSLSSPAGQQIEQEARARKRAERSNLKQAIADADTAELKIGQTLGTKIAKADAARREAKIKYLEADASYCAAVSERVTALATIDAPRASARAVLADGSRVVIDPWVKQLDEYFDAHRHTISTSTTLGSNPDRPLGQSPGRSRVVYSNARSVRDWCEAVHHAREAAEALRECADLDEIAEVLQRLRQSIPDVSTLTSEVIVTDAPVLVRDQKI